ncbi:hypothetical protein LTS18_012067, partial [Coniosporium uncinatum]
MGDRVAMIRREILEVRGMPWPEDVRAGEGEKGGRGGVDGESGAADGAVNGAADGAADGGQTRQPSGRLTDEELARQMAERMGEEGE